jgi:hypothetical protein
MNCAAICRNLPAKKRNDREYCEWAWPQSCRKSQRNLMGSTGCGKTHSGKDSRCFVTRARLGGPSGSRANKANQISVGLQKPLLKLGLEQLRDLPFFSILFSPRGLLGLKSAQYINSCADCSAPPGWHSGGSAGCSGDSLNPGGGCPRSLAFGDRGWKLQKHVSPASWPTVA